MRRKDIDLVATYEFTPFIFSPERAFLRTFVLGKPILCMGGDIQGLIAERFREFLEKHKIPYHYRELNSEDSPGERHGRGRAYNYLKGSPSLHLLYIKPDKISTLAGRIFTQLLRSTPFKGTHEWSTRSIAEMVDNYLKIHGLSDEERKRVWNILEEAVKDV